MVKIELPGASNNIRFSIANLDVEDTFIRINGWAFIEGQDARNSQIFIVLFSPQKTYVVDTHGQKRRDVSEVLGIENLDDSGFVSVIKKGILDKGEYEVGIYIKKEGVDAYQSINRSVSIQ